MKRFVLPGFLGFKNLLWRDAMIFETHAHYEDEKFDSDRHELLMSMYEHGIDKIVNVSSSLETVKKSICLAENYDFIYAAVGVHPSKIDCLNEESYKWLQEQAKHPKIVAIGEIGLDYYWDKDEKIQAMQREWFRRQLILAKEMKLPVIIHSRDAAEDTLMIMRDAHTMQIPGVIHCFSYSAQMAEEYVRMGYYIGVGGVVTFKNAKKLKEVVEKIPLEHLLLETDSPYMSPEPYRGKRNSSRYLPYVVKKIAEIKNITEQEVIAVTEQNAYHMYHIKEKNCN